MEDVRRLVPSAYLLGLAACFSEPADGDGPGDEAGASNASSASSGVGTTSSGADDASTTLGPACVHRIFVTSTQYRTREPDNEPSFDDRAGATAFCNAQADPLGGQWIALIASDDGFVDEAAICGEVRTVMPTGQPGDLVAADAAAFWSEDHDGPIDRDNTGQLVTMGQRVWTGFDADGGLQNNCWNNHAAPNASVGDPLATNGRWADVERLACVSGEVAALYCLEMVG